MTPKEKAEELINKFLISTPIGFHIDDAKQCALIAVDEITDSIVITDLTIAENQFLYWEEVKHEIEKL